VHGFIQDFLQLIPFRIRIAIGNGFLHIESFLFTRATALFRAHPFRGGISCAGVKPTGENGVTGKGRGLLGQISKYCLSHLFGEMLVTADLAQRRGENEIDVPFHQLGERCLTAAFGVALE